MWPFASLSFESNLHQAEHRVGRRAAVQSRMQIASRTAGFDLGVDQAAQAHAQRRDAFGVEFRIGYQRDVGLELRGIFRDVFGDRFAADFFFPFDQKLQIDGERAVDGAQRLHGFDVRVHLSLVVGRAARVEVAVAHGGLEGRGNPFIEWIGRLDVVMSVAQHRGLARRMQPIRVNQRMACGGNDLDVFHANGPKARRHKIRRPLPLRMPNSMQPPMRWQRTSRRNRRLLCARHARPSCARTTIGGASPTRSRISATS